MLLFLFFCIPGVELEISISQTIATLISGMFMLPVRAWIECSKSNRHGDDTEKGNFYSAVVGRAVPFVRTTLNSAKGNRYAL